ncbi:AraC family transcriptional regulator [Myroides pelagicus]|uniref:helix-turn-helix domain-containing protein n=1 Tax=Myroides pelagicus TaxID=270914 RepID=UPI002DB992CB|nr:AraC family transcriptional regulator [Myroides pelagicus]MEC4114783.1 AraC family transcriptional regulator [Myroides pelagicus]
MALLLTFKNIYQLYHLEPPQVPNGIIMLNQQYEPNLGYDKHSRLFDGLLLAYMVKGKMKAQVHFQEFDIQQGELAIIPPQIMIETKKLSPDAEIITLGISLDLITSLPMVKEFIMDNELRWNPIIELKDTNLQITHKLFDLIGLNIQQTNDNNSTEVMRHLVLALLNLLLQQRKGNTTKNTIKNRTHELIDQFYALVSSHAAKERNVDFYADKLNLTPQYLSTFLKQNTGRTTTQWIDHLLILHAKTLLKGSSLSVKEVGYELNFSDTSTFCRYFKRNTGMSPKAYKES